MIVSTVLLHQPVLVTMARWALGALFLGPGFGKLRDQRGFAFIVVAFRVLPRRMARAYASWLPWAEVLVGAGLLLGIATRPAALLSALLLTSFTLAIGLNIARRTELNCGCFGGRQHRIGAIAVARNIALLVLALEVMVGPNTYFALGDSMPRPFNTGYLAAAPGALLIGALVSAILVWFFPLSVQLISLYKSRS